MITHTYVRTHTYVQIKREKAEKGGADDVNTRANTRAHTYGDSPRLRSCSPRGYLRGYDGTGEGDMNFCIQYSYVRMCVRTYLHAYMAIYAVIMALVELDVDISAYMCRYIHKHMCRHIHKHLHTCKYTCMRTCVRMSIPDYDHENLFSIMSHIYLRYVRAKCHKSHIFVMCDMTH